MSSPMAGEHASFRSTTLQGDRQEAFDTLQEMVSADIHRASTILAPSGRGECARARHRRAMRYSRAKICIGPKSRTSRTRLPHVLNAANSRDEFDALVLVAPAHALADLRQALDEPTQRKITAQLQKDLTKVPNADLAAYLADVSSA